MHSLNFIPNETRLQPPEITQMLQKKSYLRVGTSKPLNKKKKANCFSL